MVTIITVEATLGLNWSVTLCRPSRTERFTTLHCGAASRTVRESTYPHQGWAATGKQEPQIDKLVRPGGPTWDLRCPPGRSRGAAERWPWPRTPPWGQSTRRSSPPWCHRPKATVRCTSAAGWRPAPAAAADASATAPSCFPSVSEGAATLFKSGLNQTNWQVENNCFSLS